MMLRRCLLLIVVATLLAGCNRKDGGIGSDAGGWPPSSSTPAEVSSSAHVVKVTAAPVQIAPEGSAEASIKIAISPGYHVNANPATFPYLIPTEVQRVSEPDGFCARSGTPRYPPSKSQKFAFAEVPLAVYEGDIEIKLPLRIPKQSESGCYGYPISGAHGSVPITVRVQACDTEKCFPPATLNATIPVEVK